MRYITQETFDALVAHFAEYRECNPTPVALANMAIDTLGISIAEDLGEERLREHATGMQRSITDKW